MDKRLLAVLMVGTLMMAGIALGSVVYFPGLPSIVESAVTAVGIYVIAIGAVVIGGGYLVYHTAKTSWTYYKTMSYSDMSAHGYDHIGDFPNVWGSKIPSRADFLKRCKDTANSKSTQKYLQLSDMRAISYNAAIEMMVVGDRDGKTIITCTRYKMKDVYNKLGTGQWLIPKIIK
jgi:hypothetical protein